MTTEAPHPKPSRTEYMAAFRKRQREEHVHRVSVTLDNLEYIRMNANAIRQGEKFATHLKRRAFADLDKTYIVPIELRERVVLGGASQVLDQRIEILVDCHGLDAGPQLDTEWAHLRADRTCAPDRLRRP